MAVDKESGINITQYRIVDVLRNLEVIRLTSVQPITREAPNGKMVCFRILFFY
jgi:hypothetical protein